MSECTIVSIGAAVVTIEELALNCFVIRSRSRLIQPSPIISAISSILIVGVALPPFYINLFRHVIFSSKSYIEADYS